MRTLLICFALVLVCVLGSFTDVYICPTNHHVIEERDVNRLNDKLRALSSATYILANELKREEER